jgi:CheY-like chemotaxis protein
VRTEKSVLLVDDEPHVIRMLTMTLERAGYRVESAPNGELALQRLLERDFDALVTDIQMPRMTGQELCDRITEKFPERRFSIFIMTSLVEREHREWAGKLPRVEFMEKPLSPRALIRALDDQLAGETRSQDLDHEP